MKAEHFLVSILAVLLVSCEQSSESGFSGIADAQMRWQAYNIQDYSVEQQFSSWGRGLWAKVIVKGNQVVDVVDLTTSASLPRNQYKTVDELFELVKRLKRGGVAHITGEEYDVKYGYQLRNLTKTR